MVGKAFSMLLRLLPLAALIFAFAWPAYGQDDVPAAVREQRPVIAELGSRANDFERRVEANADNDERLVNLRAELEKLAADALKAGVSFQPRLSVFPAHLGRLAGRQPVRPADHPQPPVPTRWRCLDRRVEQGVRDQGRLGLQDGSAVRMLAGARLVQAQLQGGGSAERRGRLLRGPGEQGDECDHGPSLQPDDPYGAHAASHTDAI